MSNLIMNSIKAYFNQITGHGPAVKNKTGMLDEAYTEWKNMTSNCRSDTEDAFNYLVALTPFGMGLPASFIDSLAEKPAFDQISEMISQKENSSFRVFKDHIFLNLPALNEEDIHSFFDFTGMSITNHLEQLIIVLDDMSLIEYEKKVLSLTNLYAPEKTMGADVSALINRMASSQRCIDVLSENERIHSLLIARATSVLQNRSDEENEASGEYASQVFSQAFSFFTELIRTKDGSKYPCIAWLKFVNASVSFTDIIPPSLLDYVDRDNYRSLTQLMQKYVAKQRRSTKKLIQANNACKYAGALYRRILTSIDENDIPTSLLLGELYVNDGRFDEARPLFNHVICCGGDSSFSGITALLSSYQKEIKSVLKLRKGEGSRNIACSARLKSLNAEVTKLYRRYESGILSQIMTAKETNPKLEANYVSLISLHARFEKNRGNYCESYALLESVPTTYSNYYRIFTELGLLCQAPGNQYKPNTYYDPNKAIEMFKAAYDLLCKTLEDPNDPCHAGVKKSILIPMANTFFMIGNYNDARMTCSLVLTIDHGEIRAHELLKRIEHENRNVA